MLDVAPHAEDLLPNEHAEAEGGDANCACNIGRLESDPHGRAIRVPPKVLEPDQREIGQK